MLVFQRRDGLSCSIVVVVADAGKLNDHSIEQEFTLLGLSNFVSIVVVVRSW